MSQIRPAGGGYGRVRRRGGEGNEGENADHPKVEKRFSRTLSGDEDFLEIESHRAT